MASSSTSTTSAVGTPLSEQEGGSARQSFLEIQEAVMKLESEPPAPAKNRALLAALQHIWRQVEREALISSNEEVDDVPTSTLPYVMCPYYMSVLANKGEPMPDPTSRVESLERSSEYLNTFLRLCEQLGLLSKEDVGIFHEAKPFDRTVKLAMYKRKKESQKIIEAMSAAMKREKTSASASSSDSNPTPSLFFDEEKQREYHLKLIDNGIVESLEQLKLNREELPLAKMRAQHATDNPDEQKTPGTSRMASSRQNPLAPTGHVVHIGPDGVPVRYANLKAYHKRLDMAATDADRMVIRRTDSREVFKNPNPPTETLDDLLKREAELGILYAAEDKTPVPDPHHEPTDAEEEAERQKKIEWEAWADDHERGSGNTMD